MKRGYHSTQSKIYGNIPRSEFYGFVLGYAVGTILRGILDLHTNTFSLILAVAGLGIGIWVDRKYYMVKDEPEEGNDGALSEEGALEESGSGENASAENALEEDASDGSGPRTACGNGLQEALPEDESLSPEGTEDVSMQQRLKQMFGKYREEELS